MIKSLRTAASSGYVDSRCRFAGIGESVWLLAAVSVDSTESTPPPTLLLLLLLLTEFCSTQFVHVVVALDVVALDVVALDDVTLEDVVDGELVTC